MTADPVRERAERLRSWPGGLSFGLAAIAEQGLDSPLSRLRVRFAETSYPPKEAGYVVLASHVDPLYADHVIGAALTDVGFEVGEAPDENFHLWCSESGRPPIPSRMKVSSFTNWAGKPTCALYTSPCEPATPGAWGTYCVATGVDVEGWSVWLLTSRPHRIIRIASALTWCEFASANLAASGEVDWVAVSREFDAVHITQSAAAAIDCFEFSYRGRAIPATVWGAETTVWFRWMFDNVTAWGCFSDGWRKSPEQ